MNKFVESIITIAVVIVALVAADQISGAIERARARKVSAAVSKAVDEAQ